MVTVAVNEKLQDNIVEVHQILDWMESGSTVLRIILCYAPQKDCPNDEKDELWQSIDGWACGLIERRIFSAPWWTRLWCQEQWHLPNSGLCWSPWSGSCQNLHLPTLAVGDQCNQLLATMTPRPEVSSQHQGDPIRQHHSPTPTPHPGSFTRPLTASKGVQEWSQKNKMVETSQTQETTCGHNWHAKYGHWITVRTSLDQHHWPNPCQHCWYKARKVPHQQANLVVKWISAIGCQGEESGL